jgi:hypothetical protein
MARESNDLPTTSPHGSDSGYYPQILGLRLIGTRPRHSKGTP